jgi:hypothetical protein
MEKHATFCWIYLKEREQLEDLGVVERTLLNWTLEIGWENVDWTHQAKVWNQWLELMISVMRYSFP